MATLAANAVAAAQAPFGAAGPEPDPWLTPVAGEAPAAGRRTIAIDFGDPDRAKLFRLRTAKEFIAERRLAYREKFPAFVVPGSLDDFNSTDADTLGVRWRQRDGAGGRGRGKRVGAMGVKDNAGRFPMSAKDKLPEAAVFNEELGAADLDASVEVTLGGADHEFGLLLRAGSPDLPGLRDVDAPAQWEHNSFVYAAATASRIVIAKKAAGKPVETLANQAVAAKDKFRLRFVAFGKSLMVFRDGEQVATAEDQTPAAGRYAGLVGLAASGAATAFDNFEAGAYYGDLAPRNFAAMGIKYRGPNVHHTPLYFEQRMIERHGHHLGNLAAPIVAHGLFVADLLLAPASALTSKPWMCTSSDLFARPGELVPYQITPPMLDKQAKFLNLAAFAALGFIVP